MEGVMYFIRQFFVSALILTVFANLCYAEDIIVFGKDPGGGTKKEAPFIFKWVNSIY